jgi:hypothetical protein
MTSPHSSNATGGSSPIAGAANQIVGGTKSNVDVKSCSNFPHDISPRAMLAIALQQKLAVIGMEDVIDAPARVAYRVCNLWFQVAQKVCRGVVLGDRELYSVSDFP